jgi:signal transduction histidine kinase
MRLKLFPWLLAFLGIILMISGISVYLYFQQSYLTSTEIRLVNAADNIIVSIAQNPDEFKVHPKEFLFFSTNSEFTAGSILVQFHDQKGHILAKSPSLKKTDLPYSKTRDQIISYFDFSDGAKVMFYQTKIIVDQQQLGVLVVGLPISQMQHLLENIRNIIIVVMLLTLLILGFGIQMFISLNLVLNQKKFLSFASHELRTPLAVIEGNAEVALQYDRNINEYRETLKSIKDEAIWMHRLVSNLLVMFRTQSGSERLNITQFHFGDLLLEATSQLKKRYPQKTITLNLSEEAEISADRDRIRQVVNNVLENAAQNTPEEFGTITINLCTNEKYFILEIKDNGPGIPTEVQKQIFTPFFRIRKDSKGIGLGLAITKWIIQQHKGTISLESQLGKGSVFSIKLPKITTPKQSLLIRLISFITEQKTLFSIRFLS